MNRVSQSRLNLTSLEDRLTPATIFALGDDFDRPTVQNVEFSYNQQSLYQFDSADPGTILQEIEITGIPTTFVGGIEAIDFRPATGQLYALAVNTLNFPTFFTSPFEARLYTIDLSTGAATQVGAPFTIGLSNGYGFDFNPTVDRIRVTTTEDENLRINPDDGTVINDGTLAYAVGDPNAGQDPNITASAYSNNFANAQTTELFNIDSTRGILVRQSPANAGTLMTVGGYGIDQEAMQISIDVTGLDIGSDGNAFVSYTRASTNPLVDDPGAPIFGTIDLATGKLSQIGRIGQLSGPGAIGDRVADFAVLLAPQSGLPPFPPTSSLPMRFAVGSDFGVDSRVRVFNPDQTEVRSFSPFPGFTGGTRVAMADVNGDGVADVIAGTGPGVATMVRVFSGTDNSVLFEISPFESTFTGGVFVAAGDMTGDGNAEIVITPDVGGGPRVRIFDGSNFQPVADFFGIEDEAFRGGARAAVGDVNNDGRGDLTVAAGFGGGPRIAVYDGALMTQTGTRTKLFNDFFAFEETLRNGAFPSVGDVNGDGFADLILGAGPTGAPRVKVLDGKSLLDQTQLPIADFFAGSQENRGGVRVTVKDLDGDNRADILTGLGNISTVRAYPGSDVNSSFFSIDPLPGSNGVFVG